MTLLDRLRERTGPWHRRLEAELPLFGPGSDERVYADYLAQLWGFHAPVERDLSLVPGLERAGLLLDRRWKCAALEADLEALGLTRAERARLPYCAASPRLSDVPSALGCLYVLEGATLGGQVVCRELGRRMPDVLARASRYLTIYGAETGARWREFTRVLAPFSDEPRAAAVLVDTACATFAALHRWLLERPSGVRDARAGAARDGAARDVPARDASAREGAPLDG